MENFKQPCVGFVALLASAIIMGALPSLAAESRPSGAKSDVVWREAKDLTVEGRGWADTEQFFNRLPAKAKGVVTEAVWGLSKNTAGMAVRFVTDARKISARWTVLNAALAMEHMPATGVSGLDLYIRDGSTWRWIGAGRPRKSPTNECTLVDGVPAGTHEYMLYLPLYNGVKALEIGVPEGASRGPAPARPGRRAKPICCYGTSILQGGCASRPGMAHIAIIGRKLDWATINLGFSGSGKMEPAMADLLCEVEAAAYVLDCLPNMTTEMVRERLEPFVDKLRKVHADTPIVLVENIILQNALVLPGVKAVVVEKNAALREAYDRLVKKGVTGLTYVPCDNLLGSDGEATVDGAHCTDLGFLRFAEAMEPVLRKVLEAD